MYQYRCTDLQYVCTTSIGGGDTRGHGAAEVQGGGEEISEAVQHAS